MNKLLTIFILLLSLNLYGADRPIYSPNGLEGIAKDRLYIVVEDYSKYDKTFDLKAILNQVELRLRQSGIKINEAAKPYLMVDVIPKVGLYTISVDFRRSITFEANGKTYRKYASVWDTTGITGANNLRNAINQLMDKFLLAYLKANPKNK